MVGSNIKSGVSIFGVSGNLSSADYIGYYTAITADGSTTLTIPHPLGFRQKTNIYLVYLKTTKSAGSNRIKEFMYRRYSLYKIGDSYTYTSYVYNDTNGSEASGG